MVSCHRHVQVIFQVPRGKTDIIIVLSVSATFEIVIKLWHLFRGVIGGHVSKMPAEADTGRTDYKSLSSPFLSESRLLTDIISHISPSHFRCLEVFEWHERERERRRESQQCRKLTWHSKFVTVLLLLFRSTLLPG